jgi:hypothetical protein
LLFTFGGNSFSSIVGFGSSICGDLIGLLFTELAVLLLAISLTASFLGLSAADEEEE